MGGYSFTGFSKFHLPVPFPKNIYPDNTVLLELQSSETEQKATRKGFSCVVLSAVLSVSGRTLMAVTIEDLYRSYGVLADAKDNLSPVNKSLLVHLKALFSRELCFFTALPYFTSVNFVVRYITLLCAC